MFVFSPRSIENDIMFVLATNSLREPGNKIMFTMPNGFVAILRVLYFECIGQHNHGSVDINVHTCEL